MYTAVNQAVSYYLMSCYLYYELHTSVLSDCEFDVLCKYLLEHYDSITHPHKRLFTKEDLQAGTGYAIKDYPMICKQAACSWLESVDTNEQNSN